MIRSLAAAAALLATGFPAGPVRAQDDLTRQLIGACVGCRLPKDLHGRDLHGLRFVGADLRDVDFSHANLNGAEFTGADLDGTRFDDADLRNARFVGVRIRHTSFARADVGGVRFVGVRLAAEDASTATGLAVIRDCTGCSLKGIDLHDADLRGIKVVGADLDDAKLAGARLNDARLVGASARGADLSRADLRGADLVATRLRDARLTGAVIGDAILCSENRDADDLAQRTICADLRGIDLHGIDLRAARHCTQAERAAARSCRPVTRAELTDIAHADLTGALAPT